METRFKAYIVWLILKGRTEEALQKLADHYDVDKPKLKVGLPKRHKTGVLGCYTTRDSTISILDNETINKPFVIIHEFYHHLRTGIDHKHRGNERYANEFAREYIEAYRSITSTEK